MDTLGADENDLLKVALNTAFTPAEVAEAGPSEVQAKELKTAAPVSPSAPIPAPSAIELSSSVDSWKDEYEDNVKTWRNQSAEAREKAEKERERWEHIREEEAAARKAQGLMTPSESGWESLGDKSTLAESSLHLQAASSPADGRDLTTGESPKKEPLPSTPQEKNDDQKWEDIPSSLTSSYPSMSFPETGDHTPPSNSQQPRDMTPPPTLSITTSIFDSTLSKQTRLSALASSLAINMFLPFINGVMLGFGEIFAKNVILDWMGWKIGGTAAAANVGLGREGLKDRRRWKS